MSAVLDRERILELIPHAGSMCLLDHVIAYTDSHIECTARTHRNADHPLRRDGQLSAVHLAEYAAQAMAVHGALRSGGPRPGMLAALRGIHLHVGRIDLLETELTIQATRRLEQPSGSLYDFNVRGDGQLLAEGRIAIAFL
jgi:predicted hotdog family 3-hydroxylacyl-ACP dehydratase